MTSRRLTANALAGDAVGDDRGGRFARDAEGADRYHGHPQRAALAAAPTNTKVLMTAQRATKRAPARFAPSFMAPSLLHAPRRDGRARFACDWLCRACGQTGRHGRARAQRVCSRGLRRALIRGPRGGRADCPRLSAADVFPSRTRGRGRWRARAGLRSRAGRCIPPRLGSAATRRAGGGSGRGRSRASRCGAAAGRGLDGCAG